MTMGSHPGIAVSSNFKTPGFRLSPETIWRDRHSGESRNPEGGCWITRSEIDKIYRSFFEILRG